MPVPDKRRFAVTDDKDNALASVTVAGVSGETHHVTHISASYSKAKEGGLLTLKDGDTTIMQWYVTDTLEVSFEGDPVALTSGNALNADLAASGQGSSSGALNVHGFTDEVA